MHLNFQFLEKKKKSIDNFLYKMFYGKLAL